ncbi:MAG: hypothetical protein ACOYMN_10295 [Roseimicrobium sp.]
MSEQDEGSSTGSISVPIEPEKGIKVEGLLDPVSPLEGWEHDPAGPVIGYKASADPHAFAQGAELAKIAIELARLHQSHKPAECIDEARALVFQCIRAVCDSHSEKEARYERNQQRLKDHIGKRLEPKRIPEARLWDLNAGVLELKSDGKTSWFEPYSEERKWNDLVKAHIAKVSSKVLAEQFKDGLTFRDWLMRELGAGRSLPDCVKEHHWRYRIEVAERAWEKGLEVGPPWFVDVVNNWAEDFRQDWYEEWKADFKERGVRVVDLFAIAKTRKMGHQAKGRKPPNVKGGLTKSAGNAASG